MMSIHRTQTNIYLAYERSYESTADIVTTACAQLFLFRVAQACTMIDDRVERGVCAAEQFCRAHPEIRDHLRMLTRNWNREDDDRFDCDPTMPKDDDYIALSDLPEDVERALAGCVSDWEGISIRIPPSGYHTVRPQQATGVPIPLISEIPRTLPNWESYFD